MELCDNLRLSPLNNNKNSVDFRAKIFASFSVIEVFLYANLIESAKHPPPATTIIVPSLFIF